MQSLSLKSSKSNKEQEKVNTVLPLELLESVGS